MTALWDLIKRRQVVHIRGTPATGKSTLAHLLARHVSILEPELEVYHLCWPESFDYLTKSAPYSYLLNDLAHRSQDCDDWMDIDGLLIIDEAQASYRYSSQKLVLNCQPLLFFHSSDTRNLGLFGNVPYRFP